MLGTHFPEGPAPGSASAWWPAAFQKAELAISAGKAPPPTVTRCRGSGKTEFPTGSKTGTAAFKALLAAVGGQEACRAGWLF
eukprot:scaffold11230_cov22-Tisochrysis_lutea.AAC.1